DVGRQLVPARRLLLGGADEVLDVVEVDARQVGPPGGHRLAAEVPQSLEPQLEHPLRLVLPRRDVADHLFGQAAARGGTRHVRVGPAEFVRAQPFELVLRGGRHVKSPPDSGVFSVVTGTATASAWAAFPALVTCVVQMPSPCAIVASRRTGVPSSLPKASVSASQSCGNSAATCATGQWCWQSCSPASALEPPMAGAGPADAA